MNTTATTRTATTELVSSVVPVEAGRLTAVISPDDRIAASVAVLGLGAATVTPGRFTTVAGYLRRAAGSVVRPVPGFDTATVLDRLGLSAYGRRRVETVPTQVRLLADLGAAVLAGGSRVVLDQPTAGLDPVDTRRVMELLADLVAAGVAVVIATRDIEWTDAAADTVVVLVAGTVVAQGHPAELPGRRTGLSTVRWTAADGVHEHRTRTPGAVVAELEAHFGAEVHTIVLTPPTLTDTVTDIARIHA